MAGEFGESSRKRDGRRIGEHPAKQVHHCRGEYVDAEEAEIVTGADAGHEQPLFGFGGRGLFDDGIDAIEAGAARGDGGLRRPRSEAGGSRAWPARRRRNTLRFGPIRPGFGRQTGCR